MTQIQAISVSAANHYIKSLLEFDDTLSDIWISGEISNLKVYHIGQQTYFNLIDKASQLNCVLFSTARNRCTFTPENGQYIIARGKINVFQKKGRYTFQVHYMVLDGAGNQNQKLYKLKQQLEKEGLFDQSKKLRIPPYPEHVGLITAKNSAAFWDFDTICQNQAPHIKRSLFQATMQGQQAQDSICAALALAENSVDIIIILRGGGSQDDLNVFNIEQLVRQISQCTTPIITAIGHEVDVTLTDYVADYRCPTPTAAAQHITTPIKEWLSQLHHRLDHINHNLHHDLQSQLNTLSHCVYRAHLHIQQLHTHSIQHIQQLLNRCESTNPVHRMKQGYSICRLNHTRSIINTTKHLKCGTLLSTEVLDGYIVSKVTEVQQNAKTVTKSTNK